MENRILAHPSVRNADVVAEPDPYRGECVCAHVIPRPGGGPLALVGIERSVRERPDIQAFVVADSVAGLPAEDHAMALRRAAGNRAAATSARSASQAAGRHEPGAPSEARGYRSSATAASPSSRAVTAVPVIR
ncbi:hypothetical protein GCM10009647_082540 [Streptomyces sanglieri]